MIDMIKYIRFEEHIPDRELIKELCTKNEFSSGDTLLKSFISVQF